MKDGDERDLIARTDHLRISPELVRRVPGYKEWTYYFVSGQAVDLLLTLTFLDRFDVRAPQKADLPAARVVALARRHDGRWTGAVEEIPRSDVKATPGLIDVAMGATEVFYRDETYVIDAHVAAARIGARLRLHLQSLPTPMVGKSVRMGTAGPMNWIAVPRLSADGEIVVGDDTYAIRAAPAYHDHNWGAFSWGGDFAWEWGLILGAGNDPWTVVYSRISDRARQQVRSQAIILWRAGENVATFRDDEIDVHERGLVRGGARLRIPPVMKLVEPATTADVPLELSARAAGGSGSLSLRFTTSDFAEIAIPNETPELGSTLLCEGAARAHVEGTIHGETFAFDAAAVLELNHAARGPRPPTASGARARLSGRGDA